MNMPPTHGRRMRSMKAPWVVTVAVLCAAPVICLAESHAPAAPLTSVEQGQAPLSESFDREDFRRWRLEHRRQALQDTRFRSQLRTYYLDRNRYDGTTSRAWAIGGLAGLETGYFLNRVSFGLTCYTSQRLLGKADEDGTLLLAPGQEGYTVLGEIYANLRITDGLHIFGGRKEHDTPYINRNDSRMTPNTFEAYTLIGNVDFNGGASLRYGGGYFHRIKERNSEDFVMMSRDAGADVDRGVFAAGAIYENGPLSLGAINYYSPDVINIFHTEANHAVPLPGDHELRLGLQFCDQRSVGDNRLTGDKFSAYQIGIKAEAPVGQWLFTTAYTYCGGDADMRSPWSGYPGYTGAQVEDFNREGEGALLLRAAYAFPFLDGLSAYGLWVHGDNPSQPDQFRRDEYNLNLQWAPPEGALEGFSLRLRYAKVNQHGGGGRNLDDFRVICNYDISF